MLLLQTEIIRLEVEERRLSLRGFDTAASHDSLASPRSTSGSFDVASNLRLVPQCSERDRDNFFLLFVRVAKSRVVRLKLNITFTMHADRYSTGNRKSLQVSAGDVVSTNGRILVSRRMLSLPGS